MNKANAILIVLLIGYAFMYLLFAFYYTQIRFWIWSTNGRAFYCLCVILWTWIVVSSADKK